MQVELRYRCLTLAKEFTVCFVRNRSYIVNFNINDHPQTSSGTVLVIACSNKTIVIVINIVIFSLVVTNSCFFFFNVGEAENKEVCCHEAND